MNNLKLAHLNVRSLVPHFLDIRKIVLDGQYHICTVSETWLCDSIPDSAVSIVNYTFFRRDRQGRGGGVGIYVRNDLKCHTLDTDCDIEQLWLKIHAGGSYIAICAFYRPPNLFHKTFLTEFESAYAMFSPTVDHVFCLGDFNVDFLDVGNRVSREVLHFLEGLGLKQVVKKPTRVTADTAKLLDYIMVSSEDAVREVWTTHVPEVSDHELVSCVVELPAKTRKPVFKKVRDFKNFNYRQFEYDLMSLPWNIIYEQTDIDDKVGILNDNIITLLDIHAPFVEYRITKPYAPWLTPGLRAMMLDRDRAFRLLKLSGNVADWDAYKQLRNMATAAIRREKKSYFSAQFKHKDTQKMWSMFRTFNIISNKTMSSPNKCRTSMR